MVVLFVRLTVIFLVWTVSSFLGDFAPAWLDNFLPSFKVDMTNSLTEKEFFGITDEMEQEWEEDEDVVTPVMYRLCRIGVLFSFPYVVSYYILTIWFSE